MNKLWDQFKPLLSFLLFVTVFISMPGLTGMLPARAYTGGDDEFASKLNPSAYPGTPAPGINLKQGTTNIANGGTYDFGSKTINSNTSATFTIENADDASLALITPLYITGANADQFSLLTQPTSSVIAFGNTSFTACFIPTTPGTKDACIIIPNNDSVQGTYIVNLTGSAITKTITVKGITVDNKIYDGAAEATLNISNSSLVGVNPGDEVYLMNGGATATFGDKNVGNRKAVTISNLTLGGAQAGNYTLTQPAGITANITPKSLTVSGITANNKMFDGNTAVTLNIDNASMVGVCIGDDVILNTGSVVGTFADYLSGENKTVSISGLTINGADAGNYALQQPTTTATIFWVLYQGVGGGGGGGLPAPVPTIIKSVDGKVTISIGYGVSTSGGIITITPVIDPPVPPQGVDDAGLYYDIGPNGIRFSQPVQITFYYDPDKTLANPYVAWWDEVNKKWVKLTTVNADTDNHSITAKTDHFTIFGVFNEVKSTQAAATPSPTPKPSASSAVTTAPKPVISPTSAPTPAVTAAPPASMPPTTVEARIPVLTSNQGLMLGIVLTCIPIILVTLLVRKEKKSLPPPKA